MPNSYAPEVQADSTAKWVPNGLRFATAEEAHKQLRDLKSRWTAVHSTRVMPSDDPPNYRWDDREGLVRIEGASHG